MTGTPKPCARLLLLAAITLAANADLVLGQGSGSISGTVRVASGAPVPGVTVIVTNQVTGKWKRVRSSCDGKYSFSLRAGAYRLRLNRSASWRSLIRTKTTASLRLPRGEALENVIVEAGKDTVVDIPLDQVELKEIPRRTGDKPTGHAGKKQFHQNRKPIRTRREARDRWRIGFPEYDRYGDRGCARPRHSVQARALVGSVQPERLEGRLSDQR